MKAWERDLLDHLVLLVAANNDRPQTEVEIVDGLKREFPSFLREERHPTPGSRGEPVPPGRTGRP